MTVQSRTDVVVAICRSCSKGPRLLWLPGRICEKCIQKATAKAVAESRLEMLKALEQDLGGDSDDV